MRLSFGVIPNRHMNFSFYGCESTSFRQKSSVCSTAFSTFVVGYTTQS
ncbi:hypothetical protein MIDIC_60006 [Alphaproteobacteria bacterium]